MTPDHHNYQIDKVNLAVKVLLTTHPLFIISLESNQPAL